MNVFAVRAAELIEDRPELAAAVDPLLKAREAVERQVADFDRKVMRLARGHAQVRRFMTTPGVGAITALCFLATIDDPTRFKRSRSVGAYVGLTTRRYASGEIDWTGRISKCGDAMLRSYLYEAANVLLTRVAKWSALKAGASGLRSDVGCAKPGLPLLESSPSSCTECGSTAPSSIGQRRRSPLNAHNASLSSRIPAGDDVPAGTVAVVRSLLVLRCSKEQNALHTLIHQRHPTPSCGGHAPTAERTLDPARMLTESSTPGPEFRTTKTLVA